MAARHHAAEAQPTTEVATGVFRLDRDRSLAAFTVMKMGFWPVRGRFPSIDGQVELDAEGRPTAAELEIDAGSVTTRMPPRDAHLRSSQFLDVKRHPRIRFNVHEVTPRSGDAEHTVRGILSIRGVSREVTMPARVEQHGDHIHVRAAVTIDRHDYGVRPPQPFEMIVGDEAELELDLVATRS